MHVLTLQVTPRRAGIRCGGLTDVVAAAVAVDFFFVKPSRPWWEIYPLPFALCHSFYEQPRTTQWCRILLMYSTRLPYRLIWHATITASTKSFRRTRLRRKLLRTLTFGLSVQAAADKRPGRLTCSTSDMDNAYFRTRSNSLGMTAFARPLGAIPAQSPDYAHSPPCWPRLGRTI